MNRSSRLARISLLAYPRSFRREYGDEVLRTVADLREHDGRSQAAVVRLVLADVVRNAPRMRVESLMSNHRALAVSVVLAVAVLAAAVGSPLLLLFVLAMVALAAILLRRGDRPLVADRRATSRWYQWLAAGGVCFVVGGVILAVDGPELSSTGWTIWMLSWTTGVVLGLFGLVLLSSRFLHRPG